MSAIFNMPEITFAVEARKRHDLTFCQMRDLGWYLSLILRKYPKADLQLCASRWVAGKRAVTLPWTKRNKRSRARTRKAVALHRVEILAALELVDERLTTQYRTGNEKALNAIVGKVIKATGIDAAAVMIVADEFFKDVTPAV